MMNVETFRLGPAKRILVKKFSEGNDYQIFFLRSEENSLGIPKEHEKNLNSIGLKKEEFSEGNDYQNQLIHLDKLVKVNGGAGSPMKRLTFFC